MNDRPHDRLAVLNAANAAVLVGAMVPARRHDKQLTILGVATSMVLTLVSWPLYAEYYVRHREPPGREPLAGR